MLNVRKIVWRTSEIAAKQKECVSPVLIFIYTWKAKRTLWRICQVKYSLSNCLLFKKMIRCCCTVILNIAWTTKDYTYLTMDSYVMKLLRATFVKHFDFFAVIDYRHYIFDVYKYNFLFFLRPTVLISTLLY